MKSRRFIFILGLTSVGISIAGCQQPTTVQVKPVERTTRTVEDGNPPAKDSSSSASSPIASLAAQSQRDVDLLLKSKWNSHAGNKDDGGIAEPPPRKSVVWNDPKPSASQPAAPSKSPATLNAATSPTSGPQTSADSTPTSSSAALAPDRLKTLMVDLSRELYANGAYSQSPLRELLMIAAMSMIDPQRTIDPQAIPDLTDKERELLAKLQGFFAELGKSLDGKKDTEQAIIEAVAKLRQAIVKQPTLRLPTAALCTRVGGFGDYSAFEKYTFLAQSQQKAIVYLEIGDFTSELNQKNEYVTQLAQQLTIYSDRDGIPVWKEDWQTVTDITRNKRQDFFTVQIITLPSALSVGKYQLKIRVRDEKSQAEAETTIPFEMVADPRLAGK